MIRFSGTTLYNPGVHQKTHSVHMAETHPLFPSGPWEGFYLYPLDVHQHRMEIWFQFNDGIITGGGSDDVNVFIWRGTYDTAALQCAMVKYYPTHTVQYQGHADENGIWGRWTLPGATDGFHIWPKKEGENREEAAQATETAKKPKVEEIGV